MKQSKIEVIGSFIIIFILVIMMISAIFLAVLPKVMQKLKISNNYVIKFDEIYPFDEMNSVREEKNGINLIEKYKSIVDKLEGELETYTSEKLFGYEKMIEYSYVYNDIILYNIVSNSSNTARIKLEDGYFSSLIKQRNVEECSKKLINFNKYLKNLNIDLLYIQAPYKISKAQSISSIYKDYSNENMDNLLRKINGEVNYIDLRENIEKNGLNHLKLFYKTDHHWLPETGLWATGEISQYLNDNYNMNLEIANIAVDNYNIKKYPNMFLGSDGKFVSLKNAKPEDFTLITPKFDTKLHVKILDKGIDKIDSYENTLIDWENIQYKNYYKISQYSAYAYGDRPLIEIHNEFVSNNKKILLIKDSFCEVVAPFLSLENEYLSIIDLRHFEGSLKTYINQFNPNIVIVMYNGNYVADLEDTNSQDLENMWDFE